jgi:hypothetical protein
VGGAAAAPGDDDCAPLLAQCVRSPTAAERCRLVFERRAEALFAAVPKLRARGATRVVDLLLTDDCVSAARAAKTAGLSDRASRRLFDRLIELAAVRELSGRPNFRLYGL